MAEGYSYKPITYARNRVFPITDKTVSASTWLNVSFTVQKGSYVVWVLRSSATTGAFTVNIIGSIHGDYIRAQAEHENYNNANIVYEFTAEADEVININSYTNIATTFDMNSIAVNYLL